MLTLRPAQERGHAEFGWLSARHSFSFGHYFDPRFTGFLIYWSSMTTESLPVVAFRCMVIAIWKSSLGC